MWNLDGHANDVLETRLKRQVGPVVDHTGWLAIFFESKWLLSLHKVPNPELLPRANLK